MSDRMLQINEKLQHKLAEILSLRIEVPFDFFISVVRIDCSNDLKRAKAYLSILPFNKAEDGLAYMINHKGEIQKLLGQNLNMKYTPILHYYLDETEEKTSQVYSAIEDI